MARSGIPVASATCDVQLASTGGSGEISAPDTDVESSDASGSPPTGSPSSRGMTNGGSATRGPFADGASNPDPDGARKPIPKTAPTVNATTPATTPAYAATCRTSCHRVAGARAGRRSPSSASYSSSQDIGCRSVPGVGSVIVRRIGRDPLVRASGCRPAHSGYLHLLAPHSPRENSSPSRPVSEQLRPRPVARSAQVPSSAGSSA